MKLLVVALLVKMYTSPACIRMSPLGVIVNAFWKTLVVGQLIHLPESTTPLLNVPMPLIMENVPALVNRPDTTTRALLEKDIVPELVFKSAPPNDALLLSAPNEPELTA